MESRRGGGETCCMRRWRRGGSIFPPATCWGTQCKLVCCTMWVGTWLTGHSSLPCLVPSLPPAALAPPCLRPTSAPKWLPASTHIFFEPPPGSFHIVKRRFVKGLVRRRGLPRGSGARAPLWELTCCVLMRVSVGVALGSRPLLWPATGCKLQVICA